MRLPDRLEHLYIDFDGFFASVMQSVMPRLQGKPVGVIAFDAEATGRMAMIACSKEAKRLGVKNVMRVDEARRICPEIALVPQRPDLFRRAHLALLNEISCVIPIDAVKSIDEMTARLDKRDASDPNAVAARIKSRIRDNVSPVITCSIGFAANRLLAKIACKVNKPDGVTIWPPSTMPGPLLNLPLSAISGVGTRMEAKLNRSGVKDIAELLAKQPRQLRAIWGNVNGERMWYALHGYAVQAAPTERAMYGHGRVLPPEWRSMGKARDCSRLLLTKAARRVRRDRFYARKLHLWLSGFEQGWTGEHTLPCVNDDHACLSGLDVLWGQARRQLPAKFRVLRCGVTLGDLSRIRQLELFQQDEPDRRKWERLTTAMDSINARHGGRVVSLGIWTPPPGGYAGGKIAYTRIPSAEDFL